LKYSSQGKIACSKDILFMGIHGKILFSTIQSNRSRDLSCESSPQHTSKREIWRGEDRHKLTVWSNSSTHTMAVGHFKEELVEEVYLR